jgi:secreted PhoX family phosphatase
VDPSLIFDFTASGRPLLGGTTTFIYNTRTKQLEQSFLSLAGTATNCAGGPTPWGSWLTCEETQEAPGANAGKLHGYVFEVPSSARGLVRPVALEAMGRFRHEACAIDPATGIVYETEDDRDGLFYRFLPAAPGALERGGRLQALVIREQPGLDTRNWGSGPSIAVGQGFRAAWVDLQDVTAPDGDLRLRGRASGAAVFARGEGVCTAIERGQAVIYFTCTTGGAAQRGQVWRLEPSVDGDDALSLFAESSGEAHFDMVDNIEPAPWGDLIMAEDGGGENFVRGLTPRGVVYPIMRNALNESEFCGPCFSPDGSTLFVNIQNPGITLAVSGPWETLARSARNA